jgi:hypothetical protein
MAFALSETPMQPKILLFDENNQVIDGASNPC